MMKWENLMKPYTFRKGIIEGKCPIDEFKEDCSKIIFSSAFRRLKNKTQIYPLDNNDFIRTRLAHSIEVATIAEELGYQVEKILIDKGVLTLDSKGSLGAVLKGAALIHDGGNPPFGHFGEETIQSFYREYLEENLKSKVDIYGTKWSDEEVEDFLNFEGNAEAFRQLTRLQYLKDEYGLNLTLPTLGTIIKYPVSSVDGNNGEKGVTYKKFGYFQSEKKAFLKLVDILGLEVDGRVRRHPLVFLLEAADDMAYMMADIEDAFKKRILNEGLLRGILTKYLNLSNEKEKDILRSLERLEVDGDYFDPNEIKIQIFRKRMHNFMKEEVIQTFFAHYDEIMAGEYNKELLDCSDAVHLKDAFREILEYIITDKDVMKLEIGGDRILRTLLKAFTDAVTSPKKEEVGTKEEKLYKLISSNYRFLYRKYPYKNKLYNELQLVNDFICGMTDTYALELYQTLTAINI